MYRLVFLYFFWSLTTGISAQGKLKINFEHLVNNQPANYDTLGYKTGSGNVFEINQIQYFISDIFLHDRLNRTPLAISSSHYIDIDIPETMEITSDIPEGKYDSISFTFGFTPERNKSYMYRNPPENLMFWPDVLGGGYHYMKINLKYISKDGQLSHFNCHLGIGQVRDENNKITGFIHNNFKVCLPLSMKMDNSKDMSLKISMNIEKWFDVIHQMDFNQYGRGIMENQKAMKLFCDNGKHVFTVSTP
jgi:hypothetical protein